jgi:hypothetical protein
MNLNGFSQKRFGQLFISWFFHLTKSQKSGKMFLATIIWRSRLKKGSMGIRLIEIAGLAGRNDLGIDLQRSRLAQDHVYFRFLSPMDVASALEKGEKVLAAINESLQKNLRVCRFSFKFLCTHDAIRKCKGHLQCPRPELCRGKSFFSTPIRAMSAFYTEN